MISHLLVGKAAGSTELARGEPANDEHPGGEADRASNASLQMASTENNWGIRLRDSFPFVLIREDSWIKKKEA